MGDQSIFETKLIDYMESNSIIGEHMIFSHSCHSVAEAAIAANTDPLNIVKNICLMPEAMDGRLEGEMIVATVKGEDRASTSTIQRLLGLSARPRPATPEEILRITGFPCGGVPSFGFDARFLVDEKVLQKEEVYTSGGSERSLVKISSSELVRASQAQVARIRKV